MHRVLVIDDNPDDLALAEVALSRAGFEVWLLDEPLRAVDIAAGHQVAAIVLDRRMPDSSGLEVLRALRGDPRTRPVPILFLSADGDAEARVESLQEGADDYLAKPFHPTELVLRVERLVARSSTEVHSLEGKIEDIPLADVLQTLNHGRQSGVLIVAAGAIGRLVIAEGEIFGVSKGRLTGREAMIDLIATKKGRFRFISRSTSRERETAAERIDLHGALLEAAWLEDELMRVAIHLPPADGLLWLQHPPQTAQTARPLPIDDVAASLRRRPGVTLAELGADVALAPQRISLAIALLITEGSVAVAATSTAADRAKELKR
ncbi:MAG: response regulator [Acidobacteriota bacterium]